MDEGDFSDMYYESDIGQKPSEAYRSWYKYDTSDMWFTVILSSIIGIVVGVLLVVIIQQCINAVPECEKSENYTVCKDVYVWEGLPYVKGYEHK